jgi:hypothetical protein
MPDLTNLQGYEREKRGDAEIRRRQKGDHRKQAVAIALSEARKSGASIPKKKGKKK